MGLYLRGLIIRGGRGAGNIIGILQYASTSGGLIFLIIIIIIIFIYLFFSGGGGAYYRNFTVSVAIQHQKQNRNI